jgi:hypothetical protein
LVEESIFDALAGLPLKYRPVNACGCVQPGALRLAAGHPWVGQQDFYC